MFNIIYKQLRNRHLNCGRFLSNKVAYELPSVPLDDKLETLYNQYKEQIIYSSYIEQTKLKLGYKRNKVVESILRKQKAESLKAESLNVRSFPLALRFAATNIDQNEDNGIVDQEDVKSADFSQNIELNQRKRNLLSNLRHRYVKEVKSMSTTKPVAELGRSWMHDYEIFDETETDEDTGQSYYGTQDPTIPVSKVECHGCGALLQCASSSLPGYLPSELFRGRKDIELENVICQRCHFLKNYNTAINLTVAPDEYVKMLSTISDKHALAILLVDLMDFPCSIWPDITSILGRNRPVFVVGNKVDLLPKDSEFYLKHVKHCLEQSIIESGISKINIKHISLISAETGYGIEDLISSLHKIWRYQGDVYLVGCTNVGKSSLFNTLLRSDYCKVKARNIIKRATSSQWPGTTLRMLKFPILRPSDMRVHLRYARLKSQSIQRHQEEKLRRDQANETGKIQYATLIGHIGQTFDTEVNEVNDSFSMGSPKQHVLRINEKHKDYALSKWCYDTPGVFHSEQILSHLTTEELLLIIPKQMIRPRGFYIKPGMTIFLAGLGRIDFLDGADFARFIFYSSLSLPIFVVRTEDADRMYDEFLGTQVLGVPCGDKERLMRWPKLQCSDQIFSIEGKGTKETACDILLSSAGWVGVNVSRNNSINCKVWTPMGKGIVQRTPPLIPFGFRLVGKRVRDTVAYRTGDAFVK